MSPFQFWTSCIQISSCKPCLQLSVELAAKYMWLQNTCYVFLLVPALCSMPYQCWPQFRKQTCVQSINCLHGCLRAQGSICEMTRQMILNNALCNNAMILKYATFSRNLLQDSLCIKESKGQVLWCRFYQALIQYSNF